MSQVKLYVQLLAHTAQCEAVAAMGARLCYSAASIEDLHNKVSENDQSIFLKKLVDMGHQSPIEHATFTFGVQGVSRALLAQITRHRIASFSVQSQRYVEQTSGGIQYVLPPSIAALGKEAVAVYDAQMKQMQDWYEKWVKVLGEDKKEDARFVLPNACQTRMVVTMNARELSHVIAIRACNRAQWEIRALAWAMLGHCLARAPALFAQTAPPCVMGSCTEGDMCCGQAAQIKQKYQALQHFVAQKGDSQDFATLLSNWASKNA